MDNIQHKINQSQRAYAHQHESPESEDESDDLSFDIPEATPRSDVSDSASD